MSVDFDLVADAMVFVGGSRCDHAEGYGDCYESEQGLFHGVSCLRLGAGDVTRATLQTDDSRVDDAYRSLRGERLSTENLARYARPSSGNER
jgi:hypothetical protein